MDLVPGVWGAGTSCLTVQAGELTVVMPHGVRGEPHLRGSSPVVLKITMGNSISSREEF